MYFVFDKIRGNLALWWDWVGVQPQIPTFRPTVKPTPPFRNLSYCSTAAQERASAKIGQAIGVEQALPS